MRTVSAASFAANDESIEGLPLTVLEALGEFAGAAKEGLLAERRRRVGGAGRADGGRGRRGRRPEGRHIPDRAAVRHGHEDGEVTVAAAGSR